MDPPAHGGFLVTYSVTAAGETQTIIPPRADQDGSRPDWCLRVSPGRGTRLHRPKITIIGALSVHRSNVHAFGKTFANSLCALQERVFYHVVDGRVSEPACPHRDVVFQRLRRVREALCRCAHRTAPTVPWTTGRFVQAYHGRRQRVYAQAAARLERNGLRLGRDSRSDAFVKWEKSIKVGRDVPRLIQPRRPEYNISLGCYLKPLEKVLFHAIARSAAQLCGWGVERPVVLKGMDAFQLGRTLRDIWDDFHEPAAIGLDASRFDEHVSKSVLEWEHSVWLQYFCGDERRRLRELLRAQLVNRGVIRCPDGEIRYTVPGRRMSGDMNTSSGNCMIMCAMVLSYLQDRGLRARLANNGDDCVVICEREDLVAAEGVGAWCEALGFVMKIEPPVFIFEHLRFCQTAPIWDGRQWRMVRQYPDAIQKDSATVHHMPSIPYMTDYFATVAEGGLALTGGVPVFQAFYESLARLGGTARLDLREESGFWQLVGTLQPKHEEITPAARVSFYHAFGVLPDKQLAIEDLYNQVQPGAPGLSSLVAPGLLQ